ncbi:MAG: hypothetical protein WC483_06430 [Candidatus Paceibacterota bacterium]
MLKHESVALAADRPSDAVPQSIKAVPDRSHDQDPDERGGNEEQEETDDKRRRRREELQKQIMRHRHHAPPTSRLPRAHPRPRYG